MKLPPQNDMIMTKYNRILSILVFIGSLLPYTAMSAVPSPLGEGRGEAPILSSIEQNNTTLKALRADAEARKLATRTGITLSDPEVGYKHMWEDAEQSGNLSELTIGQSFDLSTVLGYKHRAAASQGHVIDEEYRLVRMDILLDAQLTLIDLAYYNALALELDRRLGHARRVAEAEKCRLESGDTDALSYNNVMLSLAALEAERARVATEQSVLTSHLAALNGGNHLEMLATLGDVAPQPLLDDVESLVSQAMEHSPAITFARTSRQSASDELTLAKASHLPTLSATYIHERHTVGSRSQGVAVGVSLPLWANKNRVRSARAAVQAAQAAEADTELQLRNQLYANYQRVLGMQHTATLYRTALSEANNTELLTRAMDEGYISVLEYLQGIELYYDYLDRSLSADRDFYRALAELEAWKL